MARKFIKRAMPVAPKVKPGKRYVFFSSLLEESGSLHGLGASAMHKLNDLSGVLNNKSDSLYVDKDENPIDVIGQYVSLIGQAAGISRNNELIFLRDQIGKRLQKIDNPIFEKVEKELTLLQWAQEEGLENFDYLKFIQIINETLQDYETFKKNVEDQRHNMSIIDDHYKKLKDEEKRSLQQNFIESYDAYKKEARQKLMPTKDEEEKMRDTLSEIMAKKIRSVLKNINKNQEFIAAVKELYANKQLNDESLANVITNIVSIYIAQQRNIDDLLEKNKNEILKELNDLSDVLISNISEVFSSSSAFKNLEEQAMKNDSEFEQLYEIFSNLTDEAKNKILKEYDDDKGTLKKLYDEIQNAIQLRKENATYKKGDFTRKLGQSIQEKIIKKIRRHEKQAVGNNWEEIRTLARKYYTVQSISYNLQGLLKTRILNSADMAEILAQQDVQNNIINIVFSRTEGKKINLKADVSFSVAMDDESLDFNMDLSPIVKKLSESYINFLPTYKEQLKDSDISTVDASIAAFEKTMGSSLKELKAYYEAQLKSGKDEQKILEEINHIFLGGISVKEYRFYENELGYHGGSLGGSGAPDAVLNNITRMYATGGISMIDYELLLFAVLNCGATTVGGNVSGLKTGLEEYLLGGAALLMFDNSFLNVPKFLEMMKNQLVGDRIIGINLYRLNGLYIPGSYILETIYQNLLSTYYSLTDLDLPKLVKNSNNRVEITPHNLTQDDIRYEKTEKNSRGKSKTIQLDSSLSRWNDIAERANAATKIQFLFMAGMLDIFEGLEKAFDPKNIK